MKQRRGYYTLFVNLLAILIVLQFARCAWSADVGSRLRCTVADESKAVISNARLTLSDANNKLTASGTSDERGEYTFVNLPAGTYHLKVEREGFSPELADGINLDLNEVRVLNIVLRVSGEQEVIEVAGLNVSIVPQQTFLRGLLDPLRMEELPLNGRNFADLIFTQPGVTRDSVGVIGTGHSVAGARTTSNTFLLNGGDSTDPGVPLLPGLNINTSGVPLDAIEEFSVITSDAGAEYGRNAGAIVNIVTKSGGEKTHGSAWEFFRNSLLDAPTFFDMPGQKDPFHQNQFGGQLGGKFEKTFYLVSYEGFRQRQQVALNALVPSADFLATVTNPAWKALLQGFYPAASATPAPGSIAAIYHSRLNNPRSQDDGFLRLDRALGSHKIFLSLAGVNGDLVLLGDGIPGTGEIGTQRNWNGGVGDDWALGPNIYNTFRFFVNRIDDNTQTETPPAAALQAGMARFAGPFAGQPFSSRDDSANGLPYILTSTGIFSPAGGNFFFPQIRSDRVFHVQDSVGWIRGRHQIAAGAEFRRIQSDDNSEAFIRPTLGVVSSDLTSLQSGLIAGQLQNFYTYSNSGLRGLRNSEFAFFAQDSFRVFPRFTLDFGLRYELNLPMHEVHNALSNAFVMQNDKPLACQPLPVGAGMRNVALVPTAQFHIDPYCADKTNFAPRAGFAWDMLGNNTTVLRGGYGLYYDRIYGFVLDQFRNNAPFVTPSVLNLFPFDGRQAPAALDTTSVYEVNSVDPGIRTPYSERWHLTLSRQLTKDMLLNASYAGANGHRLAQLARPNFGDGFADAFRPSNGASPTSIPRNPADIANNIIAPPFAAFYNLVTDAISRYNALQLEVVKRYSRGLTLQASYTWSHSLDTASNAQIAVTTLVPDISPPPATVNNLLAPVFAPGSSCPGAFSVAVPTGFRNAVACAMGNPEISVDEAAATFVNQYISPGRNGDNYGDSLFDARHRFTANAIYELPFKPRNTFLGGWQLATILEAQSGPPLPIFAGVDSNFDGDATDRAVATGALSTLYYAGGGVGVDPTGAARQYRCTTTNGICTSPVGPGLGIIDPRLRLARGRFRQPGLFTVDASLSKRFRFRKDSSLQFRSECFNLLNRVNFAPPVQQINNPSFGVSNSQLLINNTTSRQIQFGLKLEF